MAKKTKSGLYCIQFYVNETEYKEYIKIYERFKKLGINRSAGKSEVSESAFCRRIILGVDPLHRGAPLGNKNRLGKKQKQDGNNLLKIKEEKATLTNEILLSENEIVAKNNLNENEEKTVHLPKVKVTPIREKLNTLFEM